MQVLPNTPVLVQAGNHSAFSLVTTQRSSTICCALAVSPRVRIQASLRMAAHRKSYFLAPSFDYPANGPIALGNIISDPYFPAESLLVGASRVLDGASQEPNLYASIIEGWQDIRAAHNNGRLGVWARFLEIVDTSTAGHWERNTYEDYKCDEMETQYFLPELAYLQTRVADPRVKQVMEMRRGGLGTRRAVYIITGVKIAKGLAIASGAGQERGFDAAASVDVTPLSGGAVPLGVGARAKRTAGTQQKTTAKIVGDCTFAYQLCKLRFTGIGNKKALRSDAHRKGAFCNVDNHEDQGDRDPLQLELSKNWGGADILDVEDEADDELEVGATDVVEEGESYRCIVFKERGE